MRKAFLQKGNIVVEFDLLASEAVGNSATVTEKTVEDGSIISDHIKIGQTSFSITGKITTNTFDKLQKLRKFYTDREFLFYSGRNEQENVIISDFPTDHTKENLNGFDFSMTLVVIDISTTKIIESNNNVDDDLANKIAIETNQGQANLISTNEITVPTAKLLVENQQAKLLGRGYFVS